MLERGVLHSYEHFGPPLHLPGAHPYGVVKAQWVTDKRRSALVTGGNDGELICYFLHVLGLQDLNRVCQTLGCWTWSGRPIKWSDNWPK